MAPVTHHHRSTTKSAQKSFKSKHATKGAIKELSKGKAERAERGSRKTPHQQLMSKLDRRNQARQRQQVKHQEKIQATSIFAGQNGAPRHIAIIPLTPDVDTQQAIHLLNESVEAPGDVSQGGISRVRIERFRQNVMYIPAKRDLISALDTCRLADFVVLILSAKEEVDETGELLLRSIEGQGISNVQAVVQGLDTVEPAKKRPQVTSSLKSFITHFFPTIEKIHTLDSRQECANVVRGLCTATPKGIRWRDERSWMLIEDIKWPEATSETESEVVLTGVVRGKGLKADRLAHISGWGDYQIDSVVAAPLPSTKSKKEDAMPIDASGTPEVLETPTEDRDDLATVSPEDVFMDDGISLPETEKKGVLLDDHHYFSDDNSHIPSVPKKLPKGTSSYQAAWYLDDVSDSGSDMDGDEIDRDGDLAMEPSGPEDGVMNPDNRDAMTEGGPSEYPQSEMFLDPSPEDEAQQLQEYRESRKSAAEEDLEFPDEIELHPNVLARERLARYRGLKSLKTSHWETDEDKAHEPEDWRRLLQVPDYRGMKNRVIREALVGGVKPGTRVEVHLKGVPSSLRQQSNQPLSLFSLLRHEHKHTVVNINMTLNSSIETPLKSKDELIIQCGPRRLIINPVFSSSGTTPNNVHKFDRYLHPGRNAMASFIGPVTWGSIPVLVFQNKKPTTEDGEASDPDAMTESTEVPETSTSTPQLIATGTTVAPDHSRVVAKRVILTGHPYKIHKKLVTIRYMFFNSEDVNWFKALQLWTKRGRSGFIKESLGTHGYFKATFDAKINPQDAVGVSLYKRVFPRRAREWKAEV
ncbi:hypothetical protein FQN54_004154 [Arachnomyces sp. PD_36]|nr:hypothetical protein FQN54_004154 [Arachnomyces sp. PD_36]